MLHEPSGSCCGAMQEQAAILAAHNAERAKHGASSLYWNYSASDAAQSHLSSCPGRSCSMASAACADVLVICLQLLTQMLQPIFCSLY